VVPVALTAIVPHHLVQRYLIDGLGQWWTAQTTHPRVTQRTGEPWHPVMPHHHLLVTGQAHIEFQGIGPQLQSGFETLQGIFARLMRGAPMPDNEEITPWGLRMHGQSRLSTSQ
jgi:hypothetical protein